MPKNPQDHKPKKSAAVADEPQPRIVEIRGEEFAIAPSALDDFELLLDLGRLQNAARAGAESSATMALVSVFLRMLSEDQVARAMSLARNETGVVPLEAGSDLVAEFIKALDPNS